MDRKLCTLTLALTVLSIITYGQHNIEEHGTIISDTVHHEKHNLSFAEIQVRGFSNEKKEFEIEEAFDAHLTLHNKPNSKFGATIITWLSKDEKQILAGGSYRNNIGNGSYEIGICLGVEKHKIPLRSALVLHYSTHGNKFTMLTTLEYGGSGFWWGSDLTYNFSSKFGMGIHTQRFSVTGPWAKYSLTKHVSAWAAFGIDPEHAVKKEEHLERRSFLQAVVGIRFSPFA